MLGDAERITSYNMYQCLRNLWTYNGGIQVTDATKSIGKYRLDKAFLAVELITYLTDHQNIKVIAARLRIQTRKIKHAAIFDVVSLFWKVWLIECEPKKVAAIAAFQQRWRIRKQVRIAQLLRPFPSSSPAINDADPFTLDPLVEIPSSDLFCLKDTCGKKYAFSAHSLHQHIFKYDKGQNPFTREPIAMQDIQRLHDWHALTNHDPLAPESTGLGVGAPVQMLHPRLAFTEVTSILESRFNIYCQPDWLLDLSDTDISGIFTQFHTATGDFPTPYMNVRALDVSPQLVLASELKRMLETENPPSAVVCTLMYVMSRFSHELNHSLPEWVYDSSF
jgi:hypothetical protein